MSEYKVTGSSAYFPDGEMICDGDARVTAGSEEKIPAHRNICRVAEIT
ncbi:hypothetical protein [Desulfonema magnum]|nr:hypothetical protein [Desulfonema magnum]